MKVQFKQLAHLFLSTLLLLDTFVVRSFNVANLASLSIYCGNEMSQKSGLHRPTTLALYRQCQHY